jgi:heme/copper-type cytochrome/quinol oxidase subunit 4
MFDNMTTGQLLLMIIPIAAIEVGLKIFCLVKIHKEGVENLTKLAWSLIVIFINLMGSIAFLLTGRKKDI